MAPDPDGGRGELARTLAVLGNETRLDLLHRLATPSFVPDLARELDMTRQAIQRHLDELVAVGLVEVQREARRGALPAAQYAASPSGLFAFKDSVLDLALPSTVPTGIPALTRPAERADLRGAGRGAGLLLVHGDVPGRWFGLASGASWIVGRDPKAEIRLAYDPYVSTRHAHLQRSEGRWRLTDLHSTNGTFVDFERLGRGEEREIVPGNLLTIGKSRLVLRSP